MAPHPRGPRRRGDRFHSAAWAAALILVTVLVTVLVTALTPALSPLPSALAAGAGGERPSPAGLLDGAPVPAACTHPATRWHGARIDYGSEQSNGYVELEVREAVVGHLRGRRTTNVVVPLSCSAGGVDWPELVLVYAISPGHAIRLVTTIDLSSIPAAQEHAETGAMKLRHHRVTLPFVEYDGAGFTMSSYRGTIRMRHGRVRFKHTGPITITYDPAAVGDLGGPGFIDSAQSATWALTPAPKALVAYLTGEWRRLHAEAAACGLQGSVELTEYSHLGFAAGSENSCGGGAAVWARSKGRWTELLGYQEDPQCRSLSPREHRAMRTLALSCLTASGREKSLGRWPASGE